MTTPALLAAQLVIPWKQGVAGRGYHALLDDDELRRRVAALIEAALATDAARIAELERQVTAQRERADSWQEYAGRLRCPKCTHERGPIAVPRGMAEDGHKLVYVCPCDCHADVAALKDALRQCMAALEFGIEANRADLDCARLAYQGAVGSYLNLTPLEDRPSVVAARAAIAAGRGVLGQEEP